MDSVFEVYYLEQTKSSDGVSILVSVDSVFEVSKLFVCGITPQSFNPSFCGFGI